MKDYGHFSQRPGPTPRILSRFGNGDSPLESFSRSFNLPRLNIFGGDIA